MSWSPPHIPPIGVPGPDRTSGYPLGSAAAHPPLPRPIYPSSFHYQPAPIPTPTSPWGPYYVRDINVNPSISFPGFMRDWLIDPNAAGAGGAKKGGKENKDGGGEDKGGGGGGGGGGGEGGGKKKGGEGGADAKKKPPMPPALMNCLNPGMIQHLHFDLRDDSSTAAYQGGGGPLYPIPMMERGRLAIHPPTNHIKLISPLFPWSIDIVNETGVTLDDLIHQVQNFFWSTVSEGEYWAVSEEYRWHMNSAFHVNCAATVPPGGPAAIVGYGGAVPAAIQRPRDRNGGVLRVDWLLRNTILAGLKKDDAFAKLRLPHFKDFTNVWVLALEANSPT